MNDIFLVFISRVDSPVSERVSLGDTGPGEEAAEEHGAGQAEWQAHTLRSRMQRKYRQELRSRLTLMKPQACSEDNGGYRCRGETGRDSGEVLTA